MASFDERLGARLAGAHFFDREVDKQNRILTDDTHQHQETDDHRHRKRLPKQHQCDRRATDRQRQSRQDRDRLEHTRKQQNQHGEHEQHTGADRQRKILEHILDELSLPHLDKAHTVGKIADLRQRFDFSERRSNLNPVKLRVDDDTTALVVAPNDRGPFTKTNLRHRLQRHRATC